MSPTRRTLLTATAAVGAIIAGCSQSSTPRIAHKIYVRNETHEPYNVSVSALADNDSVVFSSDGNSLLSTQDAELYGPFTGRIATIEVRAKGLHEDQETKTFTESYQPPPEECSGTVLNRLFLTEDGSEYESTCSST